MTRIDTTSSNFENGQGPVQINLRIMFAQYTTITWAW